MKKFIILLLLFYPLSKTYSDSKISFKPYINQISKTSKNIYSININIKYKGVMKEFFQDSKVLIFHEKYLISGKLKDRRITEYNILYSQINYDLNNDSDFNDSYTLIKKTKEFYIDKIKIKAIISKYLYNNFTIFNYYDNNGLLLYKINAAANPFAVYSINYNSRTMTIGLGTEKDPVKIIEFPNPNIQILIIRTVEDISGSPKYVILNEKNRITFSNEKFFADQAGDWVSIVWAVKQIDINNSKLSKITFQVKGIKPPFAVIAFANISLVKGIRLRSSPSLKIYQKEQ